MSTRATRIGLAIIKAAMETTQPPASIQRLLQDRLRRGGGLGPLFAALNQKMKLKSQKYRQMLAQPLLPPPKPTGQARPKTPLGKAGAIGQLIKKAYGDSRQVTQDYARRKREFDKQPYRTVRGANGQTITLDTPAADAAYGSQEELNRRADNYRIAARNQIKNLKRWRAMRIKLHPEEAKLNRGHGPLPTYRGMHEDPNRLRGLTTASVGIIGDHGRVTSTDRHGQQWDPNMRISQRNYVLSNPASDPAMYGAIMEQRWREINRPFNEAQNYDMNARRALQRQSIANTRRYLQRSRPTPEQIAAKERDYRKLDIAARNEDRIRQNKIIGNYFKGRFNKLKSKNVNALNPMNPSSYIPTAPSPTTPQYGPRMPPTNRISPATRRQTGVFSNKPFAFTFE